MKKKPPFFRFTPPTPWHWLMMLCYTGLSYYVWYCFEGIPEKHALSDILFFYAFGTHLFLYLFQYRAMRNLYVYLFWVMVGLVHLYFYVQLKDDPGLQQVNGHSATGLRNTIILLLLFQGLRYISLDEQGIDLVCPSKYGTDLMDERRTTIIDLILFFVYMACTVLLLFLF